MDNNTNNKYEVLETSASSRTSSSVAPTDLPFDLSKKTKQPGDIIVKIKMIDNQQIEVTVADKSDMRIGQLK